MMKQQNKYFLLTAVIFIIICIFSSCTSQQTIFDICGDGAKAWADVYDRASPDTLTVEVSYQPMQVITDDKVINAVYDALSAMKIRGSMELGEGSTIDNPRIVVYSFKAKGGNSMSFTFINNYLAYGDPLNHDGILYNCSDTDKLFSIDGITIEPPTDDNSGTDETFITDTDPSYSLFTSDKQDFSFSYNSEYVSKWDDDSGAVIYTEYEDSIPYLLVYRNIVDTESFDSEKSMAGVTEKLKAEYGDRFISAGEYKLYSIADKELPGVLYTYKLTDGTLIELLRVIEIRPNSLMQYTCKYVKGNSTATYEALKEAVATLKIESEINTQTETQVSKPQETTANLKQLIIKAAEPIISKTVLYDAGYYSLELPEGWQIVATGEYTDFSFYAYDPDKPERKIFFFCKLEPFHKSNEAKAERQQLAAMVGPNDSYGYNASAAFPALIPATGVQFLAVYPELMKAVSDYAEWCIPHYYPDLNNIKVLETYKSNIPCASTCLDNSIMRVTFTSDNNTECQGFIAAQVTDKMAALSPLSGVDLGVYCVYNFMGVTAPAEEFPELQEILQKCLSTFTFTQAYLNEAKNKIENETEAIIAQAQSMQAAYESYNAAWSARQTSYDIISQKSSDATLGYDRLYDPDTGEIYRAESGFYDSYDINRENYDLPDLQKIDGDTESYYLDGVDYYIYN